MDDLDGEEGEGVETVGLSLNGQHYTIDLSAAHRAILGERLEAFIGAARKVRPAVAPAPRRVPSDASTVRAWARSNGFEVGSAGRISAGVRAAFEEAQAARAA